MHRKLTEMELALAANAEMIRTKTRIIEAVMYEFGNLAPQYEVLQQALEVPTPTAKISKGEQYLGLPYVMLDYPRVFGKEDVFAIRSFFWWGNFFSITLQLSGRWQARYAATLRRHIAMGSFAGWSIAISSEQWQHHFEADNYKPVEEFSQADLAGLPFIKMAKKIPLQQWDDVERFFTANFKLLMAVLAG